MFDYLGGLFYGIISWFGNKLDAFGHFIGGLIGGLGDFLGKVLKNAFDLIVQVLGFFLSPILAIILGIVFFIQQVMNIAILIIRIIARLFQIAGQLIGEVFGALYGLNYTGSTSYYVLPNAYQSGFMAIINFLNQTGLSKIALILAFFIWIMTAYAVVKIITNRE